MNKELKSRGGIKGKSDEEINKFCLIAPTKRAMITQFANTFNLQRGKDIHHEEIGSYRAFHNNSAKSYGACFREFVDVKDILESNCCYNIMTHSILTNDLDLLEIERVGDGMYDTFIEDRKPGGLKNV